MRILSIALISKHNTPLWVKNYSHSRNADAELKWHTVAHCSLDYFEERGQSLAGGHRPRLILSFEVDRSSGFQVARWLRWLVVHFGRLRSVRLNSLSGYL